MKRKLQAVLFTLALIGSSAAFGQAAVAGTTAGKVGVIDIQTAILATNEGQKEFGALQTKFEPKKSDLESKQKSIVALQKQLDTQGTVISDDARSKLTREVADQSKNYKRELDDANSDFEQQKNDILRTLGNKVYATLDKYAKQNGYSVILDVSNPQTPVLWASQATNITKAVVDAYNVTSGVAAPPSVPSAPKPTTTRPGAHPAGHPGAQ